VVGNVTRMQTFATSKSRVQKVLEVLQNLDDDFILWERAVSQVIDTVTSVVRGYDSVRKPRELLLQSKIGCHKFTSAGGCGSGRESMWNSMSPDPCTASEPYRTLIETSVSANRCRNCFYPKPSAYAGHPKSPRMPARPSLPPMPSGESNGATHDTAHLKAARCSVLLVILASIWRVR
jgi:hypothetical protein